MNPSYFGDRRLAVDPQAARRQRQVAEVRVEVETLSEAGMFSTGLEFGGFLSHGGTPSYHPFIINLSFIDGIVPYKPSSYWVLK